MTLSDICIKRPVFATVISLVIVLIGIISYSRLSVRELPKIDEPIVNVTTVYRGASADVIESQVTKPLEDSLSGIEGVDVMLMCATKFRACAGACRKVLTNR
jgi:multidrug efflux pump